ncbi:hypothetical protein K505DRAFT_326727 [Melanomma pulvis-pyrius CBS 109.77]|uniref:Uncharacterized protein n=1 Tax=Melanomma pulvis-pyrius CBS 109.77 TaxID=1314802 RepID=A0A6A6X6S6_9PLEO|nr:hypothetical protein K505DRAFT_326727 [Melanomma pulvis-pyrius CBS 109.77]
MHFKTLTLVALSAAAVSAQSDPAQFSVLSVLRTAIPSESISSALAHPQEFASELASSLSAGNVPSWYQALPSDVKSYLPLLYPASTAAETTAYSTAVPTSTPVLKSTVSSFSPTITSAAVTASISSGTVIPGNSTVISTVSSATLRSTGGANSESPTTGVSTAGAPRMTAVLGAGVAGVVGLFGMFAL